MMPKRLSWGAPSSAESAQRIRRLAATVTDAQTPNRLLEIAEIFEQLADR